MELEALQEIHSEVRALGAQIVVLTPELERYTRTAQETEPGLRYPDGSSSEDCGAISSGLYAAGLLARPLQVVRKCLGQVS
jgi:hypothetical protein